MAGTSKTTIADTLCKILFEDRQLGASFFCSRNSPDCRDANKIVPTIAYQLGRYLNPYRQALCSILEDGPDVAEYDVNTQLEQLVSKPLVKVSRTMPTDAGMVIDALDECTDLSGTKGILETLLWHTGNLPIKFIVSSRPEPAISNCMTAPGGAMRSTLRLHDIEQSLVQADIKPYLTEVLESIGATSSEIDQLATRSGSLFIFVRYILPDVDYVVCAREPLKILVLAEILDLPKIRVVRPAVQHIPSVLHVSKSTSGVSTLHIPFPDFLLDRVRTGQFHCDKAQQSAYLAECCFRVMERSLRFNICGLESLYQLDIDVKDPDS